MMLAATNTRIAILDRDGVINYDSDAYIKSPQEWQPIPGSLEAIARLSQAHWRVVIATNQSGLARGLFDAGTLMAIHARLRHEVQRAGGQIDAIFICPHGPDEGCDCRKPQPGMLREIGRRYELDLRQVPFIGDSLRDLQAAESAGCLPWLVRTGNGAHTEVKGGLPAGTRIADDLAAAVEHWLTESPPSAAPFA